jgi:hypothetical protein
MIDPVLKFTIMRRALEYARHTDANARNAERNNLTTAANIFRTRARYERRLIRHAFGIPEKDPR